MLSRGNHGIVEGGASACVNLFQRFLQLQQVVGEILVELILVVKIHNESFVLRTAGQHQAKRGLIHIVPLLSHGARVVDDYANRDRNIFVMERDDVLRLPVFKHAERAAVQVRNDVLVVVDHRGVQQDFVDVFAENEDALVIEFLIFLIVLWFIWRWLIWRWLIGRWLIGRWLVLRRRSLSRRRSCRRRGRRARRCRGRWSSSGRCRLGVVLWRGRLRPGWHRHQHTGANHKREEKNPRGPIRQARNIPSWHTHVEGAILSVAAALLLSYAICRRAQPCLDGIRGHIDCAVPLQSWLPRPPGHSDYRW